MFFSDETKLIVEFLNSPTKNVSSFEKYQKKINDSSGSRISTDALLSFFSSKNHFQKHLFSFLMRANKITFSESDKKQLQAIEDVLDKIKPYFYIGIFFDSTTELQQQVGENFTKKTIKSRQINEIENILKKILLEQKITCINFDEITEKINLFIGYFCSEVLFYISKGILKVTEINNEYTIYMDKKYIAEFRRYWLSQIINEYNFCLSDSVFLNVSKLLLNNKNIPCKVATPIVKKSLYDLFGIKLLFNKNSIYSNMDDIYKVTILLIFISCFSNSGKNKINKKTLVKQKVFDLNFIERFFVYLKNNDNHFGLFVHKDEIVNKFFNFNLDAKNTIYNFLKATNEKELANKNNKLKSNAVTTIYDFFSGLNFYTYKNIKFEIDSISSNVDLVLDDKCGNYYFIKVDLGITSGSNTLTERLTNSDKIIENKDFIELSLISKSINNIELQYHGADKLDFSKKDRKHHFIILTNNVYLNFLNKDEILFYDWNILRQILTEMHSHSHFYEKRLSNIQFYNVDKLVGDYLNITSKRTLYKKRLKISENAYAFFNLGKKSVVAKLI